VAIPWVDDGWRGFPLSHTTCRNWQFGIAHFGYRGERPARGDELSSAEFRTREVAELSHLRQRGRLTLEEVRARLRPPDAEEDPPFDLGYSIETQKEWEDPPEW
jgi:hypothetical protein